MAKRLTWTSQHEATVSPSVLRMLINAQVVPAYASASEATRIDAIRIVVADQPLGRLYDDAYVESIERSIDLMRAHTVTIELLAKDTRAILCMLDAPHFSSPALRLKRSAAAADVLDPEALDAIVESFRAHGDTCSSFIGHAEGRRTSMCSAGNLTRAEEFVVEHSVTIHSRAFAAHRRALLVLQIALRRAPMSECMDMLLSLIGIQQAFYRDVTRSLVQKLAWLRERRDIAPTRRSSEIAHGPVACSAWRRRSDVAPVEGDVHGVAVVFADVVGFTQMCSSMRPEEIVDSVNRLFAILDAAADSSGVRRIETIGDCYIAACGLASGDNVAEAPARAAAFALRAAEACVTIPRLDTEMRMRVGMHVGIVSAVTLCDRKFTVYGAAVNMAARMEQSSAAGRVTISADVAALLPAAHLESRGGLDVKGHGIERLFWLLGLRKPIPVLSETKSATGFRMNSAECCE